MNNRSRMFLTIKQKIIRGLTIILTIGITGFLTSYSVIMVHNTEDPYFARKTALISVSLIMVSILTGGLVLYYLKGEGRKHS